MKKIKMGIPLGGQSQEIKPKKMKLNSYDWWIITILIFGFLVMLAICLPILA